MDLASYICLFGELPAKPDIIFDSPDQEKLFQAIKLRYKSISNWLEMWLLDYTYPEEYLAKIQVFKPEAKFSLANYELAKTVYPRTKNPFLLKFNSPESLWFGIEHQFSNIALELSGITGYPEIIGKRKGITSQLKALEVLAEKECPPEIEGKAQPDEDFLLGNLMAEAVSIATVDPNFEEKSYTPYIKAWRHALSYTRDCPQLQLASVHPITGKLIITEKHKKLPKM